MRLYDKKIDETIITILHNEIEGKLTYGKLEERLKTRLKTFSSETYSGRLKRLSESSNNQSRYAIQPVLNKKDNGRGRQVFYSLTKNARIRCDLGLPILKSETQKEKTYRILLHYMAFEISFPLENHNKKLKDENEFYNFLQHLQIPKNELQYAGKLRAKGALYTVTSWKHPQSEITFYHKDYLDNSDKHGDYEYSYRLPGISISEFVLGKRSGRIYEEFSLQKDEIIECFNLLEEKYLIKKLLSLPLLNLNEERYIIVDNSLKEFLQDCWNLHSHVHRYLEDMWKFKQKPSDEERIWYEHLWGKSLARKWFLSCKIIRRENKKNKKKLPKERVQEKLEIRKKFELIKKEYKKIIKDYSYFIVPLLNVVYPQFLRES